MNACLTFPIYDQSGFPQKYITTGQILLENVKIIQNFLNLSSTDEI